MAKRRKKKPLQEECVLPEQKARQITIAHARDAVWHLELIQHGTHIVDLYRKLFPAEFRMDYRTAKSVLDSYNRFTELVDERLFPVWPFDEIGYAYEEPSYAFVTIPLRQVEMTWHEKLFEGNGLNKLEELVVSHTGIAEDFLGNTHLRAMPAGKTFCSDSFAKVCTSQRGMLAKLPTVVSAICGSTYNSWIDLSEEEWMQCEMPEWTEGSMQGLAEAWTEAAEIIKTVEKFTEWVMAKPVRLKQVETLLKRAWVPKKERIRVTTKSGGMPLVELLAA